MKKLLICLSLLFASAALLPLKAQTSTAAPAIPQWLVVRVLQEAQPLLFPTSGLHLGQLIQEHRRGALEITYICRDAVDVCKGVYRVSYGGSSVMITITDTF